MLQVYNVIINKLLQIIYNGITMTKLLKILYNYVDEFKLYYLFKMYVRFIFIFDVWD